MARKKKYYRNNFTQILWRNSWIENEDVIIFDTETIGIEKDAYIIQLSAIKCSYDDEMNLIEKGQLNLYIKPPIPVSPKITEITGITNDMLDDKPSEKEIFSQIKEFFGPCPCIAAYNADFDYEKMSAMYIRCGDVFTPNCVLDVLEMARDYIIRAKSFKLADVTELIGCDAGITYHNSIDDTIATKRIMQVFIKAYDENGLHLGQISPYVYSCGYYKMKSHLEDRIYVNTNVGKFYFNTYYRYWCAVDADEVDIETIDIDSMMEQAAHLCETDIKDFRKFKKFADRRGGVR